MWLNMMFLSVLMLGGMSRFVVCWFFMIRVNWLSVRMMVNINNATSIISDAWSVASKDVKRLNTIMNLCLAVLDGTPFHYRIAAAKRQINL